MRIPRAPAVCIRIAIALLCGAVHAAPPARYEIVHADGAQAYLRNTAAPAPPVRAPVLDRLFADNFEVEVDNDAVLATPHGDFVVLTMSRPAAYSRTYVPCAAGMGESRAYLVAVGAGAVKVISRSFGGCGRAYRIIRDGADTGYVVADAGTQANEVRYRIRDGKVVRQAGRTR